MAGLFCLSIFTLHVSDKFTIGVAEVEFPCPLKELRSIACPAMSPALQKCAPCTTCC